MNWLESIILGIIQGLTEFIPVSSSGHLVAAQIFMTGASQHLFIQFIDIGTTVALLVFFRKRIIGIIKDVFVHKNFRLALNILITAIPAGLIGFLLASVIETTPFFGNLFVVATAMALIGIVMIVLEKLPKAKPVKDLETLPRRRALIIGLVQILALIPGVSRSGSTIIAGRLSGFSAEQAAEYSFLVSLPIMLGVCTKVLLGNQAYLADNLSLVILSNIAACLAGLFAVGFMLRYLSKHSLAAFGWYRLGLGIVLIGAGLAMNL